MEMNKAILIPMMDVALRVSPLFIVDSLCDGYLKNQVLENESLKTNLQTAEAFHVVLLFVVGTSCAIIILLPRKQLINFYLLMSLFGTLYASYICNVFLVQNHMHPEVPTLITPMFHHFWIFSNKWTTLERHPSNILAVLLSQMFLAKLYGNLKDDFLRTELSLSGGQKTQSGCYKMYFIFISPALLASFSANEPALNFAPIIEIALALIDMKTIFEILKIKFLEFRIVLPLHLMILLRNEHFLELTIAQWSRIQLPTVLRTFCLLQNVSTAAFFLNPLTDDNLFHMDKSFTNLMCEMLETSSRTYLSLICLASVLSLLAHHVERFFMYWVGAGREDDRQLEVSVPILFFILALQTGLPVLLRGRRLIRLSYIFSLIFLSCMRHIHTMSHNKLQTIALTPFSINHLRQLLLSFCLIFTVSCFMGYQWYNNPFSTWLLSTLVFGSELIFKTLISLTIYAFVLIDCQTKFAGDKTDDFVYYITFFGKLVEFLFGIFVFCNGVWMLLFESAGVVRAVIMCAHLYFNIWCEAKQLYSTCLKRKEASTKVGTLRSPSVGEIKSYDDLCTICYQELEVGVVKETRCKHLFHETCLCKWTSISNACPICHRNAFNEASPS